MASTPIKLDEMALLKCVSIKLTDDIMCLVTQQYHTEVNPETGKKDRAKSVYRWLARVCKIEDVKKTIREYMMDEHRLEAWTWPNDPTWNGKILARDSTKYAAGCWLNTKLKKMVDFDTALKVFKGWVKCKDEYNLNATYDTEGYKADNGDTVNLTDKEALIAHCGQNLFKARILKSQMPIC